MSTLAKLSVAEYEQIVAAGVFDGKNKRRIELILGELREMNPIGSEHASAIDWLNEWSQFAAPRGTFSVRIQNPVAFIAHDSEPEPDIVWARRADYRTNHPTAAEILLLIEVSESSVDFDRREKAALYAAAGVVDYWIVNLIERVVEVRREPTATGYQAVETLGPGALLSPIAVPAAKLDVAALFGPGRVAPRSIRDVGAEAELVRPR